MVTKYVALHLVVLVDAGPGTGKSSQIPRLLHAAGHGCVVCSQMYRLAAVLAATCAAADMRA
jgi:HrpA-like RNA helicase